MIHFMSALLANAGQSHCHHFYEKLDPCWPFALKQLWASDPDCTALPFQHQPSSCFSGTYKTIALTIEK